MMKVGQLRATDVLLHLIDGAMHEEYVANSTDKFLLSRELVLLEVLGNESWYPEVIEMVVGFLFLTIADSHGQP